MFTLTRRSSLLSPLISAAAVLLTCGVSAHAQSSPASSTDELSSAILRAADAKAANRLEDVRTAVERARALLAGERLLPGRAEAVSAQLDALLAAADRDSKVPGRFAEPLVPLAPEVALARAPEARGALQTIAVSRMFRDASNIDLLVQNATGSSPAALDSEAQPTTTLGLLSQALKSTGLIRIDATADVLAFKQRYEGLQLDDLADRMISRARWISAGAGTMPSLLATFGPRIGMLGIPADSAVSFLVNANLVARLAELYGLKMSEEEQTVAYLAVVAAAQSVAKYGVNRAIDGALERVGRNLGGALEGDAHASRMMLRNISLNVQAAAERAGAAREQARAAVEGAERPSGVEAPRSGLRLANPIMAMTLAAQTLAHAGVSWLTTEGVGSAAKLIFRSAYHEIRRSQNEGFRRMLMTSSGEGFLKLLLVSMASSEQAPASLDFSTESARDPKLKLIASLARSARICSPEDRRALERATSAAPAVSVARAQALAYACAQGVTSERFTRLRNEAATLTAIPQSYVVSLREQSRSDRLRMGEILLMMQLSDRDQDPKETEYFREAATKVLGLDAPADTRYFAQLRSYIVDHGGLVENDASPTGFAIRDGATASPFDMNLGYSPVAGPDLPPPPPATNATRP